MARSKKALAKRAKPTDSRPLTRSERRAAVARRRSLFGLGAAVVGAAVILVAWFPAGALITQRRTLAATTSTLAQLQAQDRALRVESKKLSTPSEIARIARQQFDLVSPGEQAYQVLPPPGQAGSATDPYSGDPGLGPVVSPSAAAELPPGVIGADHSASTSHSAARPSHHSGSSGGLFTRLLHTLEFWR